eukprot:TRINITY_DN44576_c0_g1_i1.p1 TRINITY_DN44576_c0_g1~~TRINITY_DN44576_c0_g1_i1.p1  ORF type:complete len:674 (-),score=87.26 TRINITY_DN44576_c0_g1_i1:139-2139(-)
MAVGRSCIYLELAGCRILLDCGMSAFTTGDNQWPDFGQLDAGVRADGSQRTIAEAFDVVIVSHYHTDHIGALPYLTEVLGFDGPVLMSHPTRAIGPIILKDHTKLVKRRGDTPKFSTEQIDSCFAKVKCFHLRERFVLGELIITPYYAGHVVGAVMIHLEHRGCTALYTGDFTTVPDHQLAAASLPLALRPTVMITESTHCTTIRSSKRAKEQELCSSIEATLASGGKVFIPIFVFGRLQEFCLLLEKHWARAGLTYPIYLPDGMAERAMNYFRLFASWASEAMRKDAFAFSYPHVRKYQSLKDVPDDVPLVLFAGPATLNGGRSLEIFTRWAPHKQNIIVFPGYCLPGTIGNHVLAGERRVDVGNGVMVDVRCKVGYMSHSDHTDARGIQQTILQTLPKHVVLVHGSDSQMRVFKTIVEKQFHVSCSIPAVGEAVELSVGETPQKVLVSPSLLMAAQPLAPPPLPRVSDDDALSSGRLLGDYTSVLSGRLKRRASEGWELRPAIVPKTARKSERSRGDGDLSPHIVRYRISQPNFDFAAFHNAWVILQQWLRREQEPHTWNPAPPPATGLPRASGVSHTLSFMSVRCRLEAIVTDLDVGTDDGASQARLAPAGSGGTLTEPPSPQASVLVPTPSLCVALALEWTRDDAARANDVADFLAALGAEG